MAANAIVNFAVGGDLPIQPRQVVADAACNSCHVTVQAHGGSRQGMGSQCSNCHTKGAVDRTVGSKGVACTTDAQCAGNAAGWEACKDTNGDSTPDTCVITVDPTPNQPIDFARPCCTRSTSRVCATATPSATTWSRPASSASSGTTTASTRFDTDLIPQDIRNCKKCHADAGGTCSASKPCGIGQSCTRRHLRQHRLADSRRRASALLVTMTQAPPRHAAINTWTDPNNPNNVIETCDTCHGTDADFSVDKVHNISNPYVPPYPREKQ